MAAATGRCLNSDGPGRENKVGPLSTLILEVSRRRSLTGSLSATINVNDDVLSPADGDSVAGTVNKDDKYSIVNAWRGGGLNYRIVHLAVLFIERYARR